MKPGIYNIELEQGQTLRRRFTFTETELDLTTYDDVRMQIRRLPGTTIIWDSANDDDEGSIIIESSTALLLEIPAEVVKDFDFDNAGYDIELVKTGPPEDVDKPMKGQIILNREYTK